MHFIRTFHSGGPTDVRSKDWAEFKCSVPGCGELVQIDITGREHSFDFDRERICPHCHKTHPEDALESIKAEIDRLTTSRSRIDIQIEELTHKMLETAKKLSSTNFKLTQKSTN